MLVQPPKYHIVGAKSQVGEALEVRRLDYDILVVCLAATYLFLLCETTTKRVNPRSKVMD